MLAEGSGSGRRGTAGDGRGQLRMVGNGEGRQGTPGDARGRHE